MFVVSVCALFAGHVITLNWWPLLRDSTFYCISICALLLTIYDEDVTWYESLFLLTLYGLYIFMMCHNSRLEEWANTLNVPFKTATKEEKSSLFGTKPVPPVTEGGAAGAGAGGGGGGVGGGVGGDVEGGGPGGGGVGGGVDGQQGGTSPCPRRTNPRQEVHHE
ncbi:probable sodium/potassium/calcium exchanger CG1090 [Eriocheir sinensis]|uniref:probable sodium/potassium/calcium exchanger CG1090 n=1 Tax=Eriocheir sinensis TaxID=95602 RepID=UPI0021C70690|nr:probable sodium/potassium/calcium exchanger CG1090 [Eriocheir sinensis]